MKKLSTVLVTTLLLLLLISTPPLIIKANSINENTIRVGSSGTYYPFTFLDGSETKGFEIDVWNEIGRRLNQTIEYKTASFSGLFGMLDSNKIDVIANQITMTSERKEKYYFSEPYVESGAQIVVKEGMQGTITTFKDLTNKKVGVDLGSNYEQILTAKNSEASVITYQSTDSAFHDLIIGRIDAVVIDKISALINIEEKKLPLSLAGEPFEKIENAFVFQKSEANKELIAQINEVLNDMKDDGTLEEISDKWLNSNVIAKEKSDFFPKLLKAILSGIKATLSISILSMAIGLLLGIVIAILRYLKVPVISQLLTVYVGFFRGTPLLVQLFLLYFGLPQIFPILEGMGGFTATYITLGLNASAYISEVLRGSFNTIDKGQMEACVSIGMSNFQGIRRIILPQVMRMSIPSIGNIYIDIVKGSSLAFTIGVAEMLAKAQMVASTNYKFFESYIVVAIVYWIIIEISNYLQKILEKKLSVY